jgi:type IV pilus assembly protein PilB
VSDSPQVPARRRIGDVLLEAGVVTAEQLLEAMEVQAATIGPRRRLGHVLVDLGLASERELALALGEQLRLDVVDLNQLAVGPDTVRSIPRALAQRLGVLVLERTDGHVTVAVVDPTDVVAVDDVRLHTGADRVTVVVAAESQVRSHLVRAWSLSEDGADAATFFAEVEPVDLGEPADHEVGRPDDAPAVRLVNLVLTDAVRLGASDVHVEPQGDRLRVRQRVDGLLREVMTVPRQAQASVVSRLKIVSGLDIAERRLPQDGRTRIVVDGASIDARVSTMPSLHGEKVVVRLLTRAERVPAPDELGMDPQQLATFLEVLRGQQGLVLITGPTGAGKTNTLYAGLGVLHRPERNIVTLEDPVEIQVPGITQVQVSDRTGLTFGRGLRATLRQDPDVVLVGEVRDTETAALALKASLTGHLVLTTLHAGTAVSAVTRLVDMGMEPFLVGSSVTAVVAQRLVRRPCPDCETEDRPSAGLLADLGLTAADLEGATPRRGAGCVECGDTGYRGRTGVFEVLALDARVRDVVTRTPTEAALRAATEGTTRLRDAAVAAARAGRTTFEEVLRVSPPY